MIIKYWMLTMKIIENSPVNGKLTDIQSLLEEKQSLEELRKTHPTGVMVDGYWNALEWIDGFPFRLRVDALILDSQSRIFILKTRKTEKWLNPLKFYRVPGGSLERDKDLRQVAEMEAMEEASIKIPYHDWIETGISYIVPLNYKNDKLLNKIFKETGVPIMGGKTHIVVGRYYGIRDTSKEEKADNELSKYGEFCSIESVSHILLKEHKVALNNYLGTNFPLEEGYAPQDDDSIDLLDKLKDITEDINSILDDEDRQVGGPDTDKESFKDPAENGLSAKDGLSMNFIVDEQVTKSSPYTEQIENFFLSEYAYNISSFWGDVGEKHFLGRYKGGSIVKFSVEQFRDGMLYEIEHTTSIPLRIKIVLDHLTEHPEYYTYMRKHGIFPLNETDTTDNNQDISPRENAVKKNTLLNSRYRDIDIEVGKEILDNYIMKRFSPDHISSIYEIPINTTDNSGVTSYFDAWGTAYNFLLNEEAGRQLEIGINIEKEHYPTFTKCFKIALDHLLVDEVYYDKLTKAEADFEEKTTPEQEDTPTGISESSSGGIMDIMGFKPTLKIVNFKKVFTEIIQPRMEKGNLYIYFTNSNTLLAKSITAVTKEPYNHAGIAFDKKLETMLSFDIKAGGLVYQHPLLSFNSRTVFELFRVKITRKDTEKVLTFIDKLSKSNKYNLSSLLGSYILGMDSKYIDKKGMYRFTCATFTFFILDMIGIEFNNKEKIVLSKVTPYDNFKLMNKREAKFISSGNLFEYYYKCFNIENNNTNIWKYGIRIVDNSLRDMSDKGNSVIDNITKKQNYVGILNGKILVEPLAESYEENTSLNLEDMSNHKSVSAVIIKDNKVLILYHNKHDGWTFPMGKVKNGQALLDCLHDEMREELSIDITHATPLGTFNHTYVNDGIVTNIEHTIYIVDSYLGTPINKEKNKHSKMQYIEIDALATLPNKLDPIKDFISFNNMRSLEEEPLKAKDRAKLPSSSFGYIDEKGKGHYPLHDASHTRAAISMFQHCPDRYKDILKANIKKAAKKYKVEVKNVEILKETMITNVSDIQGNKFSAYSAKMPAYYILGKLDVFSLPFIRKIVETNELVSDDNDKITEVGAVFYIYPSERMDSVVKISSKIRELINSNITLSEGLDSSLFRLSVSYEENDEQVLFNLNIDSPALFELYKLLSEGIRAATEYVIKNSIKLTFKKKTPLPIYPLKLLNQTYLVKDYFSLDILPYEV